MISTWNKNKGKISKLGDAGRKNRYEGKGNEHHGMDQEERMKKKNKNLRVERSENTDTLYTNKIINTIHHMNSKTVPHGRPKSVTLQSVREQEYQQSIKLSFRRYKERLRNYFVTWTHNCIFDARREESPETILMVGMMTRNLRSVHVAAKEKKERSKWKEIANDAKLPK